MKTKYKNAIISKNNMNNILKKYPTSLNNLTKISDKYISQYKKLIEIQSNVEIQRDDLNTKTESLEKAKDKFNILYSELSEAEKQAKETFDQKLESTIPKIEDSYSQYIEKSLLLSQETFKRIVLNNWEYRDIIYNNYAGIIITAYETAFMDYMLSNQYQIKGVKYDLSVNDFSRDYINTYMNDYVGLNSDPASALTYYMDNISYKCNTIVENIYDEAQKVALEAVLNVLPPQIIIPIE